MVQCWSQTEPAEPTELGGEVKAYRSQVLPQMMLTQGPRGWGGYHVAQAQHVRGKERVTGKRGTWIPGTQGKVALFHNDLEDLVLRTLHCTNGNEYL